MLGFFSTKRPAADDLREQVKRVKGRQDQADLICTILDIPVPVGREEELINVLTRRAVDYTAETDEEEPTDEGSEEFENTSDEDGDILSEDSFSETDDEDSLSDSDMEDMLHDTFKGHNTRQMLRNEIRLRGVKSLPPEYVDRYNQIALQKEEDAADDESPSDNDEEYDEDDDDDGVFDRVYEEYETLKKVLAELKSVVSGEEEEEDEEDLLESEFKHLRCTESLDVEYIQGCIENLLMEHPKLRQYANDVHDHPGNE